MKISFKALEQAVQKIQRISDVEFSVEMDDDKLVFRLLTPDEENEASEYGFILQRKRPAFESSISANATIGNCMRTAILAYSLVQIGDLNLRGQDFLETDEGDKPRWEVVSDLILTNWDSTWIIHLYMSWMTHSMQEGIRITSKVKIDLKTIEDQIEFHQSEAVRLQEKRSQFSTSTAKEKLHQEITREESLEEEEEPEKVDLLPNHESSFLSAENPEESLRVESRRANALQKAALETQKAREDEAARREWEEFERHQIPQEPPKMEVPPPPLRAAELNRGVGRAVSSLKDAFQTGKTVVIREPEEYLDEPDRKRT